MVKPEWARKSVERLRDFGMTVDFREFRGLGHHLNDKEFRDWAEWLTLRLQ